MREFYFGCNRRLVLKNKDGEFYITLEEFEKTSITMPAKRWKALINLEKDIDENIQLLTNGQNTNFKEHIGGGFYVSICTGWARVDIRRNFLHPEKSLQPTKDGFSLRFREWNRMKEVARIISDEIGIVKQCIDGNDHYNQLSFLSCYECSPFQATSYQA